MIGPNLSKWQSCDILLPHISLYYLAIDSSLYGYVCFDDGKDNVRVLSPWQEFNFIIFSNQSVKFLLVQGLTYALNPHAETECESTVYASKDTVNPIPICTACHMVILKEFTVLQIKIEASNIHLELFMEYHYLFISF